MPRAWAALFQPLSGTGKNVGVDTAATGDIYATENTAKLKIAKISRYQGLAPAMLDLASGRIDSYISDIPAVEYYIKYKPQYKIAARIPANERDSFMFTKILPRPPGSTTS